MHSPHIYINFCMEKVKSHRTNSIRTSFLDWILRMNPSLHTFDLVMSKHKEVQLEVLRLKLPTNTNIYSSILKYGSILIFTWDKRFINLTLRSPIFMSHESRPRVLSEFFGSSTCRTKNDPDCESHYNDLPSERTPTYLLIPVKLHL